MSVSPVVSSGVSSTGSVTVSSRPSAPDSSVRSVDHSSATAARADNSRGDSPNVITAAGERSSSAHRSPSSHFSAASGDAARRAAQAADALSLPAVTTTAQRVPAASRLRPAAGALF